MGRPQEWNRFAYVTNNPIRRLDLDGRAETEIELLWHRFQHVINNHVDKTNAPMKSKFVTNDPAEAKDLVRETVTPENYVETQPNGRKIYSNDFGKTTGTAGETGVEVVTAPAAGGAETVITARPTFTGVANTALGIASFIGPVLNIAAYSRDFEDNYGRSPTFSEMSHYLTTGDTRSEARIMFDLLRTAFAPI
jgi:hypothetical protein